MPNKKLKTSKSPNEETPFQKFERLAKKVVSVPKESVKDLQSKEK